MPTGDEAAQYRRLEHATERHGLRVYDCAACGGQGTLTMGVEVAGCATCGGEGVLIDAGNLAPCGPECPLHELKAQ